MLKNYVKLILINYLNKKYMTIVPYNTHASQVERVKYKWLIDKNINTIIDIGASTGGFVHKIRPFFPDAMIYSFEPIPDSYNYLVKRFSKDKRFMAYNLALGDVTGQMDFYINKHIGASSILEMTDLHKTAHPHTANYSKTIINIDKLDNVFSREDLKEKILLKLDVQGYELKSLKGAQKLLKNIYAIYTEVSFCKLYEGQALFNDIIEFLAKMGFKLVGIEDISQSTIDGRFLQGNAFFIKM
ncbi:MAG: FkbM family methyltransferase [Candidatus Neomarinimicrobiota bacterium]